MSLQNIPQELRALKRWVCYRLVPDSEKPDKKPAKVPHQLNGALAKSNDLATWASFEEACSAVMTGKFDGISYALAAEDGFVCVDLDNARDPETGCPLEWADPIIRALASYTEVSPSGKGYHIFVRGAIPKASHRKDSKVELYADVKIMATTGELGFEGYEKIETRPEALADLFARAEAGEFAPQQPAKESAPASSSGVDESAEDWKLVGELYRNLNTRDADAIEAAVKEQYPERYESRSRAKGLHNGHTYWWYTIDRFVKKNETAAGPKSDEVEAPTYTVQWMCEIKTKPLEWFWKGRIPRGKITVFAGQPGCAKSLVSIMLVAHATTGKPFPGEDQSIRRKPEKVLMFFCEDDAEDTVVPRLAVAGADLSMVARIKVRNVSNESKEEREFAFDNDRKILVKFLDANPDVKLVVVDPISNYTGKIKPNDEQQLRSVLVPLLDIAAERGITFIFIAHFNKRSDVAALGKVSGAVAMTGVPRSTWLFVEDEDAPEGQQGYLMLEGKTNLSRKLKGLKYTIVTKPFFDPPADEVPLIKWGEATDVKAKDVLGTGNDDENTKLKLAEDWLRQFLSDGPKAQADVRKAMPGAMGWRTMETAKKNLGVISKKTRDSWYWQLPEGQVAEATEPALF